MARTAFGAVGLPQIADRFYGRVHVAQAARGDWAACRLSQSSGWAFLIVEGARLLDARGHAIPRAEARICWRVE